MGNQPAWRGWYHVMSNTYGTWLRGDTRGWRSRHHRDHVEGDYHHPPPPTLHAGRLQRSEESLRRPPVHLTIAQRAEAGQALVWRLAQEAELIALSCARAHVHLLARFDAAVPIRQAVGRAKKHASFALSRLGLGGTVWGKRVAIVPIMDRAHQLYTFQYICDHRDEGAWVWTFRERPIARPEWELGQS